MLAFLVSGTLPCDQASEAIERKVQWDRGIYGGDPRPAGRRPFMPRKPIAPFARLARIAAWQWVGYEEGQARRYCDRLRPGGESWTRFGRLHAIADVGNGHVLITVLAPLVFLPARETPA